MKKDWVKKIIIKLVLIGIIISFPYFWFKIYANSFLKHDFNLVDNVAIYIDAYKTDTRLTLDNIEDKNAVLNILQNQLDYTGPLWYRTPFTKNGPEETYCIMIDAYGNDKGSWVIYISDNPDHCFLHYNNIIGAKFAVNEKILESLRQYIP